MIAMLQLFIGPLVLTALTLWAAWLALAAEADAELPRSVAALREDGGGMGLSRRLHVAHLACLVLAGAAAGATAVWWAWSPMAGALRLAELTGDAALRAKPVADMQPFLSGARPAIAEPFLLTSLAGHLAFFDLGKIEDRADATALGRKAADFILPEQPADVVRFPRAWTDDMFMAASIWARAARETGDERYARAAARLLTAYVDRLQRPDGLFVHAVDAPHAWGRGNGFAAFGLMEALTALGPDWPERARVTKAYQALMEALAEHQAPDGMWRQVVDEPGSYRELTVTAMTVTAMARGLRLGWLAVKVGAPAAANPFD